MSKVLDYKYSSKEIDYSRASAYTKNKEKNDCSVRAIATAIGVDYDDAHKYMSETLEREARKGDKNMVGRIIRQTKKENPVQEAGNVSFEYEYIPRKNIRNRYKLHGEEIYRKKTVKSFIDTFRDGTFLVFVSKHVFTVKDGVLIDNAGEEFRPTRKVIDAVKVMVKPTTQQMELF